MLPIDRRFLLKCTAGTFLGLMNSIPSLAASSTGAGTNTLRRMNWNQFVEKVGAFAQLRSCGALSSEEFVRSTAELGARLDLADKSLLGAYSFIDGRQTLNQSPLILAEAKRQVTFEIVLLSLEAGYSIPLHDHPKRNGVSVCVTGKTKVTHFDLQSIEGSSVLQMRSRTTIHPSETGTLTEVEGNIHTITALQHTQLIDVFSPPAPAHGGFHWYRAEPDSRDRSILRVVSIS